MKMTRKIFSLVLAMMMLVGTMFAIPAAAHEHEHEHLDAGALDQLIITRIVYSDGTVVSGLDLLPASISASWCNCSTSNNVNSYMYDHNWGHSTNEYCVVRVREYCSVCGEYRDIDAYGVNGCSSFVNYPVWPYDW